jgi:methionyl aminopeptidase
MIILKSNEEIDRIRESCKIVREILDLLYENIEEGVTTKHLNSIAEKRTLKLNAKPAFKGYAGFPASVCISLNEEVVHGIPSNKRIIKDGDLVKIDFGIIYKGYYGDAAFTKIVGKSDRIKSKLVETTEKALYKGIDSAIIGNTIGDIGFNVQTYAEKRGFSVVRSFVGHGIGRNLHEEPQVPNFGLPKKGPKIKKGLVIAIEPMINQGTHEVEVLKDQWTVVTKDRKLSAHFEHTIAVTENGPEILTK